MRIVRAKDGSEKYKMFWKEGCYSQIYASTFKDCTGKTFFSAEQFMMYHKAKIFKDSEMMDKISKSFNNNMIKDYGRQVKNYDNKIWVEYREDVVTLGTYYKFTQDKFLNEIIIEDKDYILVEASPYDKIWGIGMSEEDINISIKSKWDGLNLLGKCIMKARNLIINKYNIKELENILYKD